MSIFRWIKNLFRSERPVYLSGKDYTAKSNAAHWEKRERATR